MGSPHDPWGQQPDPWGQQPGYQQGWGSGPQPSYDPQQTYVGGQQGWEAQSGGYQPYTGPQAHPGTQPYTAQHWGQPPGGGGNNNTPLIVGIVVLAVLLLVGGGVGLAFVVGGDDQPQAEQGSDGSGGSGGGDSGGSGGGSGGGDSSGGSGGPAVPLPDGQQANAADDGEVAVGDCTQFIDIVEVEDVDCGGSDAIHRVIEIVDDHDECISDSDTWGGAYIDGDYVNVCLDVNWQEGTCYDTSAFIDNWTIVDCSSGAGSTVERVDSIQQGTTDVGSCETPGDSQAYTERQTVVCRTEL